VSAAVTSQVLVPHAPSQGHGQARPESHPAGDREAAGDVADDDAPPGWGQLGSQPAPAPERTPEVLVMRGRRLRDVTVPDTRSRGLDITRFPARL
jgi:hypothetical protein